MSSSSSAAFKDKEEKVASKDVRTKPPPAPLDPSIYSDDDDDSSSSSDDDSTSAKIERLGGGSKERKSDSEIPLMQLFKLQPLKLPESKKEEEEDIDKQLEEYEDGLTFELLQEKFEQKVPLLTVRTPVPEFVAPESIQKFMRQNRALKAATLQIMSHICACADGPFRERDDARKRVIERNTEDEDDEDEDGDGDGAAATVSKSTDDVRYTSEILPGFDLRTLPANPFKHYVGGSQNLDGFAKYVLPVLKQLPVFEALVWHYETCDKMLSQIRADEFRLLQTTHSLAEAMLLRGHDVKRIYQRCREIHDSYVKLKAEKCEITAKVFRLRTLIDKLAASPKDAGQIEETTYEEDITVEVTAFKCFCTNQHTLRYGIRDGLNVNMRMYEVLAKVLSKDSLFLDPRIQFNGTETLAELVARATRRVGPHVSADVLKLLNDICQTRSSNPNAVVNRVPAEELKGESVLHVLLCAHPEFNLLVHHPAIEIPTETTTAEVVGLRMQTLKEIETSIGAGAELGKQFESSCRAMAKRYPVVKDSVWKGLSSAQYLALIGFCEKVEKTVENIIKYVKHGLVTDEKDRAIIGGLLEKLTPVLEDPSTLILKTKGLVPFSVAELLEPLESFDSRLKSARSAAELKDIEDHKAADGTNNYVNAPEAKEAKARPESENDAKLYRIAMEEFAVLRSTRRALASTSRFDHLRTMDIDNVIAQIMRNRRGDKRNRSAAAAAAAAAAGDEPVPKRRRLVIKDDDDGDVEMG
jgi:hypothetical protein